MFGMFRKRTPEQAANYAAELFRQAEQHLQDGRPDDALKAYTNVVRMREVPELIRAQALIQRAMVYFQTKQTPQAFQDLDEVLQMQGTLTEQRMLALHLQAMVHYALESYEAA